MRFGKIEYLNLLPFDIFVKGYRVHNAFKMMCNYKKSYPAKLNKEFLFCRIDSGFLSSIASMHAKKEHVYPLGIIAYKEVWSVLILDSKPQEDYQSATSNALCAALNRSGAVLIGDRALRHYYNVKERQKAQLLGHDMAALWYEKTGLPFVFGRVYFYKNHAFYKQLFDDFTHKIGTHKKYKGIKIPHYILMQYVRRIGITKQFGRDYLERIYYVIGKKESCGLDTFYRMLRLKKIKPPKRFETRQIQESHAKI